MGDPLKGKREGLNSGELKQLTFHDKGTGCPVKVGDVFKLRSCRIEITEIQRNQRGKGELAEWFFVAQFERFYQSKPYLLGPRGYTHDPKQALKANRDLGDAQEPEPEAVPPQEVGALEGSNDAYHRHILVVAEARAAHESLPIERRLASVRRAAADAHIDLSSHEQVIKQRLSAMERRVFEKGAARRG